MIELTSVFKYYGHGAAEAVALRGVNLRVEAGLYLAITGPSGSGKSTLLAVIGTLERPDEGSYRLEGREVSRMFDHELARLRSHTFGFVFQAFHLLDEHTALHNVVLPMRYGNVPQTERKERALMLLERVGLSHRIHHRTHQLSGGERQRVAIARAMANDPKVILADEPTGNLDTGTRDEILDLFDKLHGEGRSIVVVTHDPEVAARAGRVLHMRDGQIISET
ncbi:ABC transporter ATP-binding protein [Deinococcota bacterium DY0809b]